MKSKRFWAFLFALAGNFWLFHVGINVGTDFISLGTGLALVNAPLIAYIAGESYRPSGTMQQDLKPKETQVDTQHTMVKTTTSETTK